MKNELLMNGQKSKTGKGSTGVWLEKARKYAKTHATKHIFVTTDNVLAAVGTPMGKHGSSSIGAIFRNGMFTKVGYTPSTRPSSHRREIGVWRLK
jgi:hypothetical protein